jgi:hypothetical protein
VTFFSTHPVLDAIAVRANYYDPLDPNMWLRIKYERMLKEESPRKRAQAAEGLQNLGWHARPAVPALVDALKDENERVRDASREALEAIAPEFKQGMSVEGVRP